MNKAEISQTLEVGLQTLAWQSPLQEASVQERVNILNGHAGQLAIRFAETFDQWKALFDTVHDLESSDSRSSGRQKLSHPINLWPQNHPVYGDGVVQAEVMAAEDSFGLPAYHTEFSVAFTALRFAGPIERLTVPGSDHPNLITGWSEFVYPSPDQFMTEGFEWSSLKHENTGAAWSSLVSYTKAAEEILYRADETRSLLLEAVANTVRNPRFAPREA